MNAFLAQIDPSPSITPLINPTTFPAARFGTISNLMSILTPMIMLLAALIFGGMLFRAAYKIITASGDPEKIADARRTVSWAVVGIIVISLSYFLVRLVGLIFNVTIAF